MSLDGFPVQAPAGWAERSVKSLFEVRLGKMLQNEAEIEGDRLTPYLKAQHVQWGGVVTAGLPEMWASQSDRAKFGVKAGDLLVCEGGEAGRAAILNGVSDPAIIQNALHRIRPRRDGEVRFFKYVLSALAGAGWFDVLCNKATIAHLTSDKLGAVRIGVPPVDRQRRIADFLDHRTAAIDEFIHKKERFIDLLQEKRQALITEAVTKGFDLTAKMKPSGLMWLGEIPSHWRIARLKHQMARIVDCPHTTPELSPDGPYPAVRTADISWGKLLLDGAQRVSESVYRDRVARLEPVESDILYSREGERFGMAALVPAGVKLCLGQRMMIFRASPSASPRYFMWVLNSQAVYQQVKQDTVGATAPRINIPTIANAYVPVPPLFEQERIAGKVEKIRVGIDKCSSSVERHIRLLAEYRQALITAAVTGKIEVA